MDIDRIRKLVDNSYYRIMQVNGQRTYSMRNVHSCYQPTKGTELFVGKLPRDMFEDELVPIFARIAPIFELRLMIDFMGLNRGYCFVRFFTIRDTELALSILNDMEVRPGSRIGVYKSLDNRRLFVGGLPQNKTKSEVKEALDQHFEDIKDVIMYPGYHNPNFNRGYVFLEFADHKTAAIARRSSPPGSVVLWGMPIKVDWAEPLPEPDPHVMSKVTTLYIRNIPFSISNSDIHKCLSHYIPPDWITRIHKILDYAFVHFSTRANAEQAMNLLQNVIINKHELDISWARPENYSKRYIRNSAIPHFCLSLPAKLRWQVKKKVHAERRKNNFELSSDSDSQRSYHTQTTYANHHDQHPTGWNYHTVRYYDDEPSTSRRRGCSYRM